MTLLLALALVLAGAAPAAADPVSGTIAAFLATTGAALNAAAFAVGGALGLSATATWWLVGVFQQTALGVALSAIGRALMPKPRSTTPGVKQSVQLGDDAPGTIILGRYATAGDLVYVGSHGEKNKYYTFVVELADFPARLRRVMVNGAWCTLSASSDPLYGKPVVEYRRKGKDRLWVRFYDGTQTAPDHGLRTVYGDDPFRPWEADMLGLGVPYAVVTACYDPEVHRGVPKVLFELDGARLYDPRQDSSVGGAGPQRWSDPSSWTPFGGGANENPVVQIYNLMLGLRDPVTDAVLWGGRDIAQDDLPVASWFAAMNACDADAHGADGVEPQYRAGLEVSFTDDGVVADAIEELLKACQGQIAEVAGSWIVQAGAAAPAVYAFSDDDLIVTSPEDFEPFPGLEQVFNGVTATYSEPEDAWQSKEAPKRFSAGYLAEDGRRQVADLAFPAVNHRSQVQRLMASALKDSRRFRRHTVVLPPEARALGPLDVVAWTSLRNGYADKLFAIDLVEDLPSGCVAVSLREIDPGDYDFAADELLPTTTGFLGRPPRLPRPIDFSAEGAEVPDASGAGRRPAIRLGWNPETRAEGVRWQYRLVALAGQVPLAGGADYSDDDLVSVDLEVFDGEPLAVFAGEGLSLGFTPDVAAGTTLVVAGILPASEYQVRLRYTGGSWCPWIEVVTPDTRLIADDLDAALNDRIDQAQADANAAAADSATALEAANDALDQVATLAGDTIADLEALLAELGGIDAGDIVATRLLALAALQSGWNADPTFQLWSSGSLDKWSASGLAGIAAPFAGTYGGGLALDMPSGASAATLIASSATPGQMPAADPEAPWLVLYALVTFTAGSADALRLRAEWLADGASVWSRGDMLGLTAPQGTFTQLGIAARPGVQQGIEVLVKRPAGLGANADGVRLVLEKVSSVTTAVDLDVHLIGLRQASEAEIAAGQAAANLAAAVSTLSTTITGVADALAAYQVVANAATGAVAANLAANYLTSASVTAAISAATTTLNATIAGVSANLATNYYTRVQTDAGIATAVGGVATTLGGQIAANTAAISDETGFRVAADGVIAGRVGRIEARADAGAVVSNGSFATGDFTGWNGVAVPGEFTVVAKGGTGAQASCPTPFMLKLAFNAADRTLSNERFPAKEGDHVTASFQYAALSGSFTPRLLLRWLDAGGAQIGAVSTQSPGSVAAVSWAGFTSPSIGPAPAGTAYVRVDVVRAGGGSGNGLVTGIDARKGDTAALARLATTEGVASSALGAIGSLTTTINASFGSKEAFVSQASAAIARVDSLASTWVMRQKAGAATGVVEAVAFTSPDGSAISTLRWAYDHIDLDGRVSARDLVIDDSTNLVPDSQLQTTGIWPVAGEWSLIPTSTLTNARSIGEIRFDRAGASGFATLTATRSFPVSDDASYTVTFRSRGDGSAYGSYAVIQWLNAAGSEVGTSTIDAVSITSASTVQRAKVTVTPAAGAVAGRWRFTVNRATTTSAYVRFFAPSIRRQSQSVEIADGAITAEKANFSDLGALCATLGTCTITSALNFADGVVLTGAIGANAVSDIGVGLRDSLLTVTLDDTWYDVCSYSVSVAPGANVILSVEAQLERTSLWNTTYGSYKAPAQHVYRVLRDSTEVFRGLKTNFVDTIGGSGSRSYKLQIKTSDPNSSGSFENLTLDSDGDYQTIDVPWTSTTRNRTARVESAQIIVQCFKR